MNKQLKTFAEEAGCFETMHGPKELIGGEKELILFAELVRQDERKSCAKILDAFAKDMEKKEEEEALLLRFRIKRTGKTATLKNSPLSICPIAYG